MEFCSKCGKPLEENARFCSFCGEKTIPTTPTVGSKNIVRNPNPENHPAEPLESEKIIVTESTEFCKNCGEPLEENARFCSSCGAKTAPSSVMGSKNIVISTEKTPEPKEPVIQVDPDIQVEAFEPAKKQETPPPAKASGVLNVTMLVWSIFFTLCCCPPVGAASLILTILAKNASTAEEEAKKLRAAKICNWIGVICWILYIAFEIAIGALSVLAEYL